MDKNRATLRDYDELPKPLKKIVLEFTDKHIELTDEQIQSIVQFISKAYIEGYTRTEELKNNNNAGA